MKVALVVLQSPLFCGATIEDILSLEAGLLILSSEVRKVAIMSC